MPKFYSNQKLKNKAREIEETHESSTIDNMEIMVMECYRYMDLHNLTATQTVNVILNDIDNWLADHLDIGKNPITPVMLARYRTGMLYFSRLKKR